MNRTEIIFRFILGAIFIFSGIMKLLDPAKFYGDIQGFEMIGNQSAFLAAYIIPWLEVGCGFAFLVRCQYRGALAIYTTLMIVFTAALVSALARGLDLNCGCFGGSTDINIPQSLTKNVLMLAGLIFLCVREWKRGREPELDDDQVLSVRDEIPVGYVRATMAAILGIGLLALVSNADLPNLRNSFVYAQAAEGIIEYNLNPFPVIADTSRSFSKPVGFAFLSVPLIYLFGLNIGLKVGSFLGTAFFLGVAYFFFVRMNRRVGIDQKFLPIELGLLFLGPLVVYQFWSAYPDTLFAGEVLLAFVLSDKIVHDQNPKPGALIVSLGLVIYAAIMTKLYGLILGIACPAYFFIHWRELAKAKSQKLFWLVGVFAILGAAVVLARLGANPTLDFNAGNTGKKSDGMAEMIEGITNPSAHLLFLWVTTWTLTCLLSFNVSLLFLFQRSNTNRWPLASTAFAAIFVLGLLPFGREMMDNIRYFIPALPFAVVGIVHGIQNMKNKNMKIGIFAFYGVTACILILNYNAPLIYEAFLPYNEKVDRSVIGKQGRFDNFRMGNHLKLARKIALINENIEPSGSLYWISRYYGSATHGPIERMGIRSDIKVYYPRRRSDIPDSTVYITGYRKSKRGWKRKLEKRFNFTPLGEKSYRMVPKIIEEDSTPSKLR